MRARHLKALKSPFTDKNGDSLWDGNVIHLVTGDMLTDAFFRPLARREGVCADCGEHCEMEKN